MELELIEDGPDADPEGCPSPGFLWGCCIIHFWDWAAGICGSEC